ncbi:thiamine ABC transporter substrate binding subunit [Aestuariivirga sp.]|uniref:thiamine ABC transporter substrate binding subunit n=1 Tax=Aestuariivirga sp. TaxID=2650926 RepID=UPI00391DEAEE
MKKTLTALFALLGLAVPAAAQETLTVYTYDSFVSEWGPGPKVKEAFEKECGCTLEWVAPGDGVAMLNRLKLEGRNTKADVVLGLDTNLTAEAEATGLFGKHGLDVGLAKTPIPWADETFMPFDYAHFAVVYDSETMKQPPKSLDELVNGDPAQKIVLQDPRSSTPGLGFLLWMKSVYGEKAAEAWKKLQPRILTVTPGWSEAYALFTKGEAPMVLSYTTSPAYHVIAENSTRYKAASFTEGHYLQVEVAGLIENSPEKELAKKFLAFMMGPGFQDQIPTSNWMFPAGQTSASLPPAFGELVQPVKTLLFTPEEVEKNRRAWIDEWLNATAK